MCVCPEQITDSDGKSVPNPEFLEWFIIYSYLVSCLQATLTPSVLAHVIKLTNASEIMATVEKRHTSLSRSHIHQLKNSLQESSKGSKSMLDYLASVKDIADKIAIASEPILDEDLVLHTLKGLLSDYAPLKTNIRTRPTPVSFEDLSSSLCSEELHMEAEAKLRNSSELNIAFLAHVSYGFCGGGGNRGGRSFYRNHVAQVICQICEKPNHTASECWYCLDPTYQVPLIQSTPHAHTAAVSNPFSNDWFLDSGANNHVTSDLSSLSMYRPYSGDNQVTVGSGQTLPIINIGQPHEEDTLPRSQ